MASQRPEPWLAIALGCVALAFGLDAVSFPSSALFAGVVVGIAAALVRSARLEVPPAASQGAYALTGVVTGHLLSAEVLRSLAGDVLPVASSLLSTLVLTVLGGYFLAAVTRLDRPTAVFGMVAGGASGVIAVSEDVGADARLVAVMQYLRILMVLAVMPVVAGLVMSGHDADATLAKGPGPPVLPGIAFCVVAALAGIGLARVVRLPSGSLLGPMLLVAAVMLVAPGWVRGTPPVVEDAAFVLIGLQVGLRFDREQLRLTMRSLPVMLGVIGALIAGCAALGLAMATWTGRPFFDCYLATTPGGLYAVLATAVQGGAEGAFVTSAQVLRLFAMLLAAPTLGWVVRRSSRPPAPALSHP